mmetsp:Transcript_20118/g.35945  ORF Transcript_20118/g.35945 Transcript_20118/m.35945 type:complete len:205 (-) Transcript_20118:110-724(-)
MSSFWKAPKRKFAWNMYGCGTPGLRLKRPAGFSTTKSSKQEPSGNCFGGEKYPQENTWLSEVPALAVGSLAISCGPMYTASVFSVPTSAIINDWSSPKTFLSDGLTHRSALILSSWATKRLNTESVAWELRAKNTPVLKSGTASSALGPMAQGLLRWATKSQCSAPVSLHLGQPSNMPMSTSSMNTFTPACRARYWYLLFRCTT